MARTTDTRERVLEAALVSFGGPGYEATSLDDLKVPPGNHLERLKGNRVGQHSIRINDQFRICFVWKDGHAYQVEIADYH